MWTHIPVASDHIINRARRSVFFGKAAIVWATSLPLSAMFDFPRLVKLMQFHPRLLLAVIVGILAGFSLPDSYTLIQCAVIGWNCGVWLYLGLIWFLMVRSKREEVKQFAEQEDESASVVLILVCIAATASLAAIVLLLGTAKNLTGIARALHYGFTVATVMGSWFLVGTIFAVHYTRLFYRADDDALPLRFPDDQTAPHYWDFLYFSFTIAAAAQTADISLMQTGIRKVVLAQSVLAFLFNAAILGLSINIAAGLMGN